MTVGDVVTAVVVILIILAVIAGVLLWWGRSHWGVATIGDVLAVVGGYAVRLGRPLSYEAISRGLKRRVIACHEALPGGEQFVPGLIRFELATADWRTLTRKVGGVAAVEDSLAKLVRRNADLHKYTLLNDDVQVRIAASDLIKAGWMPPANASAHADATDLLTDPTPPIHPEVPATSPWPQRAPAPTPSPHTLAETRLDEPSVTQALSRWRVAVGTAAPVPVPATPAILGRSAKADIRVDNDYVSGQHLRLIQASNGDGLIAEVLGQTNVTVVDGARRQLGERVRLTPGSVIRIGEHGPTLTFTREA